MLQTAIIAGLRFRSALTRLWTTPTGPNDQAMIWQSYQDEEQVVGFKGTIIRNCRYQTKRNGGYRDQSCLDRDE
jgi:hypothetical protein